MIVNIHNAPAETTTKESKDAGGIDILDVFIGGVKADMAAGGFDTLPGSRGQMVNR
jgi:hypothetical protein